VAPWQDPQEEIIRKPDRGGTLADMAI
jgi:hypothetical protein